MINETLLAFIWEQRLLNRFVITSDNEEVSVISTGYRNNGQGPDFLEAQLRIGNTLWFGNVEIHVKSSDWFIHCHQIDSNYSNVICHVVWKNDANVFYKYGNKIPTIEMSKLIPPFVIDNFNSMMMSTNVIPCSSFLPDIPEYIKFDMIETCFFEGLVQKMYIFEKNLREVNNDFDELFYRMIVRSFGFKINNDAFFETAKKLPFSIVRKYAHLNDVVDALLFGQADLLNNIFFDAYPQYLKKEYNYYSNLHLLTPQKACKWNLLRLRPANFPVIRLAQCAAMLKNGFQGLNTILDMKKKSLYYNLLCTKLNEYWNTHFLFDKQTNTCNRSMGKSSADIILINTVVPLMFFYGKYRKIDELSNAALNMIETISAENNLITRKMNGVGFDAKNAIHSQGLLILKRNYCDKKKCLKCKIGNKVLRK